ncbi:hypothetical protein EDD86DRAFT_192513 [Gorgonomyces haynaldii]|nr:hypothetical protein EDD86DRAFT_192513 [Gorgonomyces haynaldii]
MELKRIGPKRSPVVEVMPGFEQTLETHGHKNGFALQDVLAFMKYGAQAIAQDEFSKCFQQKPRNDIIQIIVNGPNAFVGWIWRYFILFPYRLMLIVSSSLIFFTLLPLVLNLKNEALQRAFLCVYCQAFLLSWGAKIKRHGKKPKLLQPHIFVSNHTSIIDYIVLSADGFPHAVVAQKQPGLLGFFLKNLLTLNGSLLMERSQKGDRAVVSRKLREHVHDPSRSPLLIFPEGTCVNNEYTVLFHKGAFDLDAIVAPVAIKYDKKHADAYWHARAQSFPMHLFYLMTRWALVAEVWYLEPRPKRQTQTAVEFANEVKAEISAVAKLKNLSWDGYFKNYAPPVEKQNKLKQIPRHRYGALLMNRLARRGPGLGRRHSIEIESVKFQGPSHPYSNKQRFFAGDLKTTADEQSNTDRNRALVALLDASSGHHMVDQISDRRNNVVDTWKHVKGKTDTQLEQELFNRRIEYSSWRVWFKRRLEKERQMQEETRTLYDHEEEGMLKRVSSFLSQQSLFRNGDETPTLLPRTRSFGSIFDGFMSLSMSEPVKIRKRSSSIQME